MGLNHVYGISNYSRLMWKFCPQEDFYTAMEHLEIPIENYVKVKENNLLYIFLSKTVCGSGAGEAYNY